MEKTRLELLIYCYQEKKNKPDFHKPGLIHENLKKITVDFSCRYFFLHI